MASPSKPLPVVPPPAPVIALCANCPAFRPDTPGARKGGCRSGPPVALGAWPPVRDDDYCMEHPARRRDASWDAACEAIAREAESEGGIVAAADVRAFKGRRQ